MQTASLVAARELSPLIVRLRDDTETKRNVADSIVDRLRDGRLCRLAVAEALAGLEVPLHHALDVYETLAYADASVGWVVWNNALPCYLGRFLAPAARGEVFGDPRWLYACSTRPTGRATRTADGYRVSGRWGIVSGCELAEWILLLCVVEENGAPRMPSTLDSPLGRVPIICSMAAAYGAQALGVAQSAVDTLVELTSTKAPPEGPALRERPAVLADIARQSAALEAARTYLHACAERLWRTAEAGGPPAIEEITALWGAGLHAADAAETAVDRMYADAGINSLYTTCPIERAHRDMHAMRRHIVAQALWLEDAGRVRLGAAPVHPLYAV